MPALPPRNPVVDPPAAPPQEALAHFQGLLSLETDCSDVHAALAARTPGLVVLDVRSPALFAAGHLPGALCLPHGRIDERSLAGFPADSLFVVYCAGPHCNGADRAAVRLARLGRRVKKMIGGVTGWLDEGYSLSPGET